MAQNPKEGPRATTRRWLRRTLLVLLGLLLLAALGLFLVVPGQVESAQNRVIPHEPYQVQEAALALHRSLLVADLHADTLLWNRSLLERSRRGHVDLPRLQEGNVALQVFPAVTKSPAGQNYVENKADSDQITLLVLAQLWPPRTWHSLLERALYQAERLEKASARAPDAIRVIRTLSDLEQLLNERREGGAVVGGVLATEGGHPLEGDLKNVEVLFEAGYRMIGLHHFFDNRLGGSLHGVAKPGLSDFGRQVVREAERREIMIDVAHSAPRVVEDVLEVATRPLVVSHTGLEGACSSPRNLPDDLLRRIAAGGGLIGVGYWDGAVCDISPAEVVRSIRYAIDLLGAQHVALGSDYDGATEVAFDTSELAVLTGEMLRQGFSESEIRAVMGENQIRFFSLMLPQR